MGGANLSASKDIVLRLLRGDLDAERDRMMFEEDIVLFALLRLDDKEPEWLLREIANTSWPREVRESLAAAMVKHRAEAAAALKDTDR
ncbi:hypothetical protein J2W56_002797 [Nocardia kruczakiae]|uniref:Uncharacterized protein n=1 Tax=Nocardia kruczakiae TaxID=261477 RepID=A0ABU1XEU6_9NOCA|nr:hypothetical protein [Nocardia kruczakiae]MDR7169056.1 hypothetical protein [Nocardia kruczakiae]